MYICLSDYLWLHSCTETCLQAQAYMHRECTHVLMFSLLDWQDSAICIQQVVTVAVQGLLTHTMLNRLQRRSKQSRSRFDQITRVSFQSVKIAFLVRHPRLLLQLQNHHAKYPLCTPSVVLWASQAVTRSHLTAKGHLGTQTASFSDPHLMASLGHSRTPVHHLFQPAPNPIRQKPD